MRLRTIGYERATPASLIAALRAAGVRTVVDVRALANSRRPGFSKRALSAALDEAGIGYVHERALGTPAEGRAAVRNGRPEAMRPIFLRHLQQNVLRAIADLGPVRLEQLTGRIVLDLSRHPEPARLRERLARVFGIANSSLALRTGVSREALRAAVGHVIAGREFGSFRITARRAFKTFPMTSVELNRDEYSRPSLGERAQAYEKLHTIGALESEEIRAMERFDGTRSASALTGGDTGGE